MITFMKQNGRILAVQVDGKLPEVNDMIAKAIEFTNVDTDSALDLDESFPTDCDDLSDTLEEVETTLTINENY